MWLLITQVSIPVYRGTKLFPIFKREEKLKTILSEIKQQNIEKELERKIRKAKEEDAKKSTSPKMSSIFTEDETQ
jgi:hypothetical protein